MAYSPEHYDRRNPTLAPEETFEPTVIHYHGIDIVECTGWPLKYGFTHQVFEGEDLERFTSLGEAMSFIDAYNETNK